jgi:hypothetical protein
VAGRAKIDDGDGYGFSSMVFDIKTGSYDRLTKTQLGPPAIVAHDGAVLGVSADEKSVMLQAGGKVTNLPASKSDKYVVSSLSRDGKVAGGYSVTDGDSVGNEPLWWHCR